MAAAGAPIEKWQRARVRHRHEHPAIRNVNKLHEQSQSVGDRIADSFAETMGSWSFIIIQSMVLVAWIAANIAAWAYHWDPYPFILLNLALSFEAAYAAPIIMMSQNRQSDKDRIQAEHDYAINIKAEEEIKSIMHHLEQQDEIMLDMLHRLEEQHHELLTRFQKS